MIETSNDPNGFRVLVPKPRQGVRITTNQATRNEPVTTLTDGRLERNFGPIYANGVTDGAYKMDLGSTQQVARVSSWSYNQAGRRGVQRVEIFGSAADEDPGWNTGKEDHYTRLGAVDTTDQASGQFTAAAISADEGKSFGSFRWIVWRVHNLSDKNRQNTAFQELAVETGVATQAAAAPASPPTKASQKALEKKSEPTSKGEILVYQGDSGPGVGKHLVFIASDHEYHSEETCPAVARILAKRFGFKCTVLFGQDEQGFIKKGANYIPGMEVLKEADLLFLFLRFQDWDAEQMDHLLAYLKRGGPVIGLRTTTHAFKIADKNSPYAKFSDSYTGEDFPYGFGKQILGLSWSKYGGHYSRNHQQSVRIDVVPDKAEHPINRGVTEAWAYGGGYRADLGDECDVIATAQPLIDIYPGSKPLTEKAPQAAAWTRSYRYDGGPEGKVFTTIYGGSPDIVNRGFRRMLINAVFWGVGLEDKIDGKANVNFVGPYTPTFGRYTPARIGMTKPSDLAGWDSEIFPNSGMKEGAKALFTQEQLDEQSGE